MDEYCEEKNVCCTKMMIMVSLSSFDFFLTAPSNLNPYQSPRLALSRLGLQVGYYLQYSQDTLSPPAWEELIACLLSLTGTEPALVTVDD
jgi:hypothetical protein